MGFDTNVFINCPYDAEYNTLQKPLIYTIIHLGLEPQLSQNKSSAITRIEQIKNLIRESKFSIHDLSRCKPLKGNRLPRFNMPFELGLDIGCFEYGGKKFRDKKMLILETNRYHYQKVLSDIAGQDIENHNDDPKILVSKVRNWFSAIDHIKAYPEPTEIWKAYHNLIKHLTNKLSGDIQEMPIADFIKLAKNWVQKLKNPV
jgi:hypothetical protein